MWYSAGGKYQEVQSNVIFSIGNGIISSAITGKQARVSF